MGTPVTFSPPRLDFGAVAPGSTGPSIIVDPSFGPPGVSFAGGVQIDPAPADARVTVGIERGTPVFQIRDIILMEWVLESVDPTELPPGHHGPLPKVRVLEVVARSIGPTAVDVKKDQVVLVRAMYVAPAGGAPVDGSLEILGDTWDPIQVSLSLFPSGVLTTFLNTPIRLAQGRETDVTFENHVVAGPDAPLVHYELSRTQLDTGVTIIGRADFPATSVTTEHTLALGTAPDAPLGDNALAIDQVAFNQRTGFLVPMTVTADPTPDEARAAIARKAAARADVLGAATSPVVTVNDASGLPIPGGFVQHFQRGDIYFTPAFGAHDVYGEIQLKYDQSGGPLGLLGFPETDVTGLADRQGLACDFHAASIYWHPAIGPRIVIDPIRQFWRDRRGESGEFGYPVRDHHPMRNTVRIDLPDPNGVAWATFENGAIVTSQEGTFKALEVPAPELEPQALEGLRTFIRARFDKEFRKSPDNVGLHPQVEILGTLPYEHDLSQSTARAVLFRLHGFHDNGLAGDTDFTIDLGIRIGWKLDPTLVDTRTLTASLAPGSLMIRVDGPGEDQIRSALTQKILAVFASGVALSDLPIVKEVGGRRIWVIVDVITGLDGGVRVLVNPEQRGIVDGAASLGPSLRDAVERELLELLSS
jgi:hypothetical protein